MVPFGNFGVREDCVVAADDASRKTTCDVVVGGVVAFSIACRVILVLPVTVLGCMFLSEVRSHGTGITNAR